MRAALPGRVLHLTHADNWKTIRTSGLLTARTLIEQAVHDPAERDRLLARPRSSESCTLHHPRLGTVRLRDQGRLNAAVLARLLDDDWTVGRWCRHLNDHVFFFPGRSRHFEQLCHAYAGEPQVLLEVETRSLTASYDRLVKVSSLNTGSTGRGTGRRGAGTFVTADRYTGPPSRIQEVAVRADIGDLQSHLRAVWLLEPGGAMRPLAPDADVSA